MSKILTTHAGSLIRPPEIIEYLGAIESGADYDRDGYETTLRDSVADIVGKQVDVGLDVIDDGEMGKATWITYLYERVSGLEIRAVKVEGQRAAAEPRSPGLPRRLRRARRARRGRDPREPRRSATRPIRSPAASGHAPARSPTTTRRSSATSPTSRRRWRRGRRGGLPAGGRAGELLSDSIDEHYGSMEAALMGVAEALREEYRAIVDAGLSVQVDDAFVPFMYDVMVPPARWRTTSLGAAAIAAINHALEGIPPERVRYHVCWGSWNGPHTNDIPLRDVLPLVLAVNAGTYLFENANPRHEHEWRVWEDVELPPGRKLAPGVISHATNVVEHPELVAERLERLARIVGADNVLASTDCGFAQGPYLRRVHPSIQWAKLEALAEGAAIASRNLARA